MSHSLHEEMEHAAHATHDGHGHDDGKKSIGKYVGMTMATLGVVMALCSAVLGGSRTELVATMVEQNGIEGRDQAVANKHRMLLSQLQMLKAVLPADIPGFEKTEGEIAKLEADPASQANAAAIRAARLETSQVLNAVIPTEEDVRRFIELVRDYTEEREKVHEWAESYAPAVHAYSEAAEHYEWALLCAEFGTVLCAIALLLGARPAWLASCLFGAVSVAILAWAFASARGELHEAHHKIEEAKAAYDKLQMNEKQKAGDDKLLSTISGLKWPDTSPPKTAVPAVAPLESSAAPAASGAVTPAAASASAHRAH